jgi:hypothetical protein
MYEVNMRRSDGSSWVTARDLNYAAAQKRVSEIKNSGGDAYVSPQNPGI